MTMMTEIEAISLEEWKQELEENNLSSNDPSSLAQDALMKITPELGAKFLLPQFIPLIKNYVR